MTCKRLDPPNLGLMRLAGYEPKDEEAYWDTELEAQFGGELTCDEFLLMQKTRRAKWLASLKRH